MTLTPNAPRLYKQKVRVHQKSTSDQFNYVVGVEFTLSVIRSLVELCAFLKMYRLRPATADELSIINKFVESCLNPFF
jgi:hypothetical protein